MEKAVSKEALFSDLQTIFSRPKPFEFCSTADLWTDEYTSARMLECHLDENIDLSSRKLAFIERSVEWLVSHFKIGEGTSVIDFGCGPGLYASRLAQRGAQVTGIDFSSRSISYAREIAKELGLEIDYIHQDYLEFNTEKLFDLVLMIFCDLCALSPAQRGVMLEKYRSILKPGGRVVLDVTSLVAFDQLVEGSSCEQVLEKGFWSAKPHYCFQNSFKYDAEKVFLDKYTIVESGRTRTIYNWLQYYLVDSLTAEFREHGLEILEVYDDVAGSPFSGKAKEFAVVSRKMEDK